MYQLYVRGDDAFVEDVVGRAIAAVTARSASPWTPPLQPARARHRKRYVRQPRVRATAATSRRAGMAHREADQGQVQDPAGHQGHRHGGRPTIALDHGVDWIYVSNHGGRQLDHGRGAMQVLPEIVEA